MSYSVYEETTTVPAWWTAQDGGDAPETAPDGHCSPNILNDDGTVDFPAAEADPTAPDWAVYGCGAPPLYSTEPV